MIVQEDVPYTKEEVKAMVKTIHDLREKLSLLGWRPASETPKLDEDDDNEFIVIASVDNELYRHGPMIDKPKKAMFIDGQWTEPNVKWWCYPPKED